MCSPTSTAFINVILPIAIVFFHKEKKVLPDEVAAAVENLQSGLPHL